MKKVVMACILSGIMLFGAGCGKRQEQASNVKLIKVVKIELKEKSDTEEEDSQDEYDVEKKSSLVDSLFNRDKKDELQKIINEIEINDGMVFEDELIKIDFEYEKEYIVSKITNKGNEFFYIDWDNGYFKKNDDKKEKIVRTNVEWLSIKTAQTKEAVNNGEEKKVTYTSFKNIGYEMGLGALDMKYWVKGELLKEVEKIEFKIPIKIRKKEYNYIFKFYINKK